MLILTHKEWHKCVQEYTFWQAFICIKVKGQERIEARKTKLEREGSQEERRMILAVEFPGDG